MDKKKALILRNFVVCLFILATTFTAFAQNVSMVKFCDKKYEYGIGKDSISLYFKIIDSDGKTVRNISEKELNSYLVIKEDEKLIPSSKAKIMPINAGLRIPADFTFSVLVDLSIPDSGKEQIFKAIEKLVESAPDGCVYLSFFGDSVSKSQLITKDNFETFSEQFHRSAVNKYFYGALYAKLSEFNNASAELEDKIIKETNYIKNPEIAKRAALNSDKNILFIFADGHTSPAFEENIAFLEVTEYQKGLTHIVPTVFAFYYTEQGQDVAIENVLMGVCNPHIKGREGKYMPASNMQQVLANFEEVVHDQMYDYVFTYRATDAKKYFGKTSYEAVWKGDDVGSGDFSIGTAERPWPEHSEDAMDVTVKYLIAFITALLTIVFFLAIMKILVPYCQSKFFELKYYKKYVPEENVSRRICHYCKQEIKDGQSVVMKCKHIMHVHCWKQNGYKCAEYGQNCKTGIQQHIEWSDLFTIKSVKDCYQTIAGILAGFVSWIVFELIGRGGFEEVSDYIVKTFYTPKEGLPNLTTECIEKTSAFLVIGLLLGFFLSLIFRYNDEYRNKDWKIGLKILALSILTSIIGMVAFAIGAYILCLLLSLIETTYIPWYCSLPAYLIFSLSVALALTIKSSVPVKSALLGGGFSALIGFIVLYFSPISGRMNMLLDFVIYGGGLGASLITVRILAEKYFLIIQNGIKAGQRIPIHKWMNATGGGNKVSIGMTGDCEIQMNWEKSNKVAKEHVQLYIDHERQLPMIKPLAIGVIYNMRVELPVGKPNVLSNGDTIKIGDTTFLYVETE
jgi:hypothetical protein